MRNVYMLNQALSYHDLGWSIFPVKPPQDGRHGHPHVKWAEFQTKRPSRAQIEAWWKRWPDAGIALITGRLSGIIAVDVDIDKKGGTVEGLPPTGVIADTPGGKHYLYRYPKGTDKVWTSAGGEGERRGRDVRADGGFINLSPSPHHSGSTYRWRVFELADLGTAPGWTLVNPRAKSEDDLDVGGENWLTELLEKGTKEGNRNADTMRLAGYLAKKAIPEDFAAAVLNAWNDKQVKPLGSAEVTRTVQSAYDTERRNNPRKLEKAADDDVAAQAGKHSDGSFKMSGLNDFMTEYIEDETKWLVEGWIPEATIGFVTSMPGGFKTWLMLDLAVAVASGRPFLGKYPVGRKGPVLIFQQEDHNPQTASRMAKVLKEKFGWENPTFEELDEDEPMLVCPLPPTDAEAPIYLHCERALEFTPEGMEGLRRTIKRLGAVLVICDPFYALIPNEDNMARAAKDMKPLKLMRDETGCSILLVHHITKAGESAFGRGRLMGSNLLNAFNETMLDIRRPEEFVDTTIVKRHFKSAKPGEPVKIDFEINDEDMVYKTTVSEITHMDCEALLEKGMAARDAGHKRTPTAYVHPTIPDQGSPLGDEIIVLRAVKTNGFGILYRDVARHAGMADDRVQKALVSLQGKNLVALEDGKYCEVMC